MPETVSTVIKLGSWMIHDLPFTYGASNIFKLWRRPVPFWLFVMVVQVIHYHVCTADRLFWSVIHYPSLTFWTNGVWRHRKPRKFLCNFCWLFCYWQISLSETKRSKNQAMKFCKKCKDIHLYEQELVKVNCKCPCHFSNTISDYE